MIPSSNLIDFLRRRLGLALIIPVALAGAIALPVNQFARAQAPTNDRTITLRSDVQEADSKTGVITARGNVQIYYPAQEIQATAAQAQYFSRERRIVLSGNVYVLQHGNSLRGETITYLIDEKRFVALPQSHKQVESIYIVPDNNSTPAPVANSEKP